MQIQVVQSGEEEQLWRNKPELVGNGDWNGILGRFGDKIPVAAQDPGWKGFPLQDQLTPGFN